MRQPGYDANFFYAPCGNLHDDAKTFYAPYDNLDYDPNRCDHKPPREWDARDIQGVLNQQGIEPQPGPDDSETEDDLIAITSRNIHGLDSHLAAAIRGRDRIICLREADLAESNVYDIRAQAQTAGYDIFFSEPPPIPNPPIQKNHHPQSR